jgi:crossover junction endodeoxyribonuclease RusA
MRAVITVAGRPAPQGSKAYKGKRAGKPVLVESSRFVKPWREQVHRAAVEHRRVTPGFRRFDGPVKLTAVFTVPAPKRLPKGRVVPGVPPDLSKLLRSTEDALTTGGLWADDALVVEARVLKRYPGSHGGLPEPGALIIVERWRPDTREGDDDGC